jgi:hypothetical protein
MVDKNACVMKLWGLALHQSAIAILGGTQQQVNFSNVSEAWLDTASFQLQVWQTQVHLWMSRWIQWHHPAATWGTHLIAMARHRKGQAPRLKHISSSYLHLTKHLIGQNKSQGWAQWQEWGSVLSSPVGHCQGVDDRGVEKQGLNDAISHRLPGAWVSKHPATTQYIPDVQSPTSEGWQHNPIHQKNWETWARVAQDMSKKQNEQQAKWGTDESCPPICIVDGWEEWGLGCELGSGPHWLESSFPEFFV